MKIIRSTYFKYILLVLFLFMLFWSLQIMRISIKKLEQVSGSTEMLDFKPCITAHGVYHYLEHAGNNGRSVLTSIYLFEDFIYPIAYGCFLFFAIIYFLDNSYPQKKRLWLFSFIPILAVCFDYIENFSIVAIIQSYPHPSAAANWVGSITLCKWIFAGLSCILLAGSFATLIRKNYVKHQKS